MPSYSTDRRGLLKIIGAIGATCAYPFAGDELYAQAPAHEHAHSDANSGSRAQFLNDRDLKTVSRIADLIIPETDTPSASGAGVPVYIDQAVSRNREYQAVIADGLRWLDAEAAKEKTGTSFLELTEAQQLAILQPLCEAHDAQEGRYVRSVQFFALVKNLTADGYYTSEIGLVRELGFKNEILAEYPSCSR